jgi:NADP-dependent 3-hydroxy acid dehydrogenase YdfG
VIAGRRASKLEEVARQLREKYSASRVVAIQTDVTVQADVENLFERTKEEFGRCPDVVLANAGVMEKHNRIAEQDVDEWWNSMVCPNSWTLFSANDRARLSV